MHLYQPGTTECEGVTAARLPSPSHGLNLVGFEQLPRATCPAGAGLVLTGSSGDRRFVLLPPLLLHGERDCGEVTANCCSESRTV